MRLLPLSAMKTVRAGGVDANLRMSSALAMVVIAINLLGIAASLTINYSMHSSLDERSGVDLLQRTREDYRSFEETEHSSRDSMAEVREMETTIDLDSSERQILALVDTLHEDEETYQLFLRLLKVNTYHLAEQIPGALSWYEIHGPELDLLIERSRARQLRLLEIKRRYSDA